MPVVAPCQPIIHAFIPKLVSMLCEVLCTVLSPCINHSFNNSQCFPSATNNRQHILHFFYNSICHSYVTVNTR